MARKYRNIPTIVDGVRFDSKREANRWGQLRLMEKAGIISGLERQVAYPLVVNDVPICAYRADFRYVERGTQVVEDAKGFETPEFKLKARLMKAVHGIEVRLS